MIRKFRKKPVIIKACQLTEKTFELIVNWIGLDNLADGTSDIECVVEIITLEGNHHARKNNWVIQGVQGEFYPCKPDIFKLTYEEVKDE